MSGQSARHLHARLMSRAQVRVPYGILPRHAMAGQDSVRVS